MTKPYDAVDQAGVFRPLGMLSNRGVELSVAGQPGPGWTIVAGAVLLDASVSGAAVDRGLIGKRPVGSTRAKLQANAEYAPAGHWSFDLGANWRAAVIADTDGRTHLPPRATLDLGARYRFKLGHTASVLRFQVTNLADAGGYVVLGPGAYKLADRRQATLTLTTDL